MKKIEVTVSNESYLFAVWAVRNLGYESPERFLEERLERHLRDDMQTTMVFPDQSLTDEEREIIRERDFVPEEDRYYEDEGGGIWPPSKRPKDDDDDPEGGIPF